VAYHFLATTSFEITERNLHYQFHHFVLGCLKSRRVFIVTSLRQTNDNLATILRQVYPCYKQFIREPRMFKPKFVITNQMANALTAIERARGFLEAAILSPDWMKEMQRKALISEAFYTTHIEGTQLTLEQSEQLWEGQHVEAADPDDVQELLNYRQAFELVSDYIGVGEPIIEGLIREIHKRLVQGVRGNSAAPGEYRKIQNFVVNSKTKEVVYTPPPVYEISPMMQELVDWINQEVSIHPVLVSGIAQFQLVHIHPFLDGNGRSARLLSTLCLYRHGYDFKRLFTLSEYYDRNRVDYYQAIQSVRNQAMDMSQWLEYFLQGLATQLLEIKNLGKAVIKQDMLIKKHRLSIRQKLVISYINSHGSISIQECEKICLGVTRRTLQRELKDLVDKELIQSSGATNHVLYALKNIT
jgi:Fic family protein